MTEFEFKCKQSTDTVRTVSMTTNEHTLNEVLMEFETFLRGCGYYFDGHLEFVDDRDFQTHI